jgi:hypothetical protein
MGKVASSSNVKRSEAVFPRRQGTPRNGGFHAKVVCHEFPVEFKNRPDRVMKLDKEVGTIEPGKRADLIIVDGNPLENIRNIRRVKTVIANGRLHDCARLWQSVGFKP